MKPFTGTVRLARLALRRDRVQLPIWLLAVVAVMAASASSVVGLYPSEQERVALAVSSSASPVALMTNGLVSGTSLGATVAAQALLTVAVAAALMSTLAVVRHTRQNEETGRAELIGSAVVGHRAPLTAALVVVGAADLLLGLLAAATLVGIGLPVGGSVLSGAAIAGVGMVFASVAAVTAQVSETARGANGLAAAAVGAAFLLRAVGDAGGDVVAAGTRVVSAWPSWLSPIGWGQQTRPYDLDQWWVLGVMALTGALLVATAFALVAHRDLGAGLRATPPGPAEGDDRLLSPLGLAWRLQRGVLTAWLVAVLLLGATYGGAGDEVDDFLGDSEAAADLIEQLGGTGDLVDAYFAATFVFAAIAAAGYLVQAVLRMRAEEASGRLEPVLATSVARTRWMLGHILVATVGSIVLVGATGLASAVTYGWVVGDIGGQVAALAPAALAYAPATLAMGGVAVAAFGLWPRHAAAVSWGAFAGVLLLSLFGPLLDLPRLVLDLSPFSHVPGVLGGAVPLKPLGGLVAVAVAVATVGVLWFRRRDLTPS